MLRLFTPAAILGLVTLGAGYFSFASAQGRPLNPYVEVGLLTGSLDRTTASREGLGAHGFGLQLGGGLLIKRILSVGLDFGVEACWSG